MQSPLDTYQTAMQQLQQSAMLPQGAVASAGITDPYMDQRRQQAKTASARPRPGQNTVPLAGVKVAGNGAVGTAENEARLNAYNAPQANPYLHQQALQQHMPQGPAHPNIQQQYNQALQRGGPATFTVDSQGVAHGYTEQRGGESFQRGAQGQLVDPAATAAPEKGAPTWKDYQKGDKEDYAHLSHTYDHITGQIDRTFDTAKKAALQQQLDATHVQMDALHQKIRDPKAMQNYQRDQTNGQAERQLELSGRNGMWDSAVNEASKHIQQPTQVQPGESLGTNATGQQIPYTPHANQLDAFHTARANQEHQQMHANLTQMGLQPAAQPGMALQPEQIDMIKKAARGDPETAKRLATELGYDHTKPYKAPVNTAGTDEFQATAY